MFLKVKEYKFTVRNMFIIFQKIARKYLKINPFSTKKMIEKAKKRNQTSLFSSFTLQ